jgi:hypothetical protein
MAARYRRGHVSLLLAEAFYSTVEQEYSVIEDCFLDVHRVLFRLAFRREVMDNLRRMVRQAGTPGPASTD